MKNQYLAIRVEFDIHSLMELILSLQVFNYLLLSPEFQGVRYFEFKERLLSKFLATLALK